MSVNQSFWFSSFSAVLHWFSSSRDPVVTRNHSYNNHIEKESNVKRGFLAIALVGLAFTISSCGDQSISNAQQMVAKACPNVMKNDSSIVEIGKASMLDAKWIPLSEAASFFRLNKDSVDAITNSNFKLELAKAQATIFTYCAPYLN